mmetsp:Transcript_42262/g.78293  ORF Transcript_42262/g.78293 Transcript_42262/m.78293 type:complete len:234 (+) Transcript_42262:227-928(+)
MAWDMGDIRPDWRLVRHSGGFVRCSPVPGRRERGAGSDHGGQFQASRVRDMLRLAGDENNPFGHGWARQTGSEHSRGAGFGHGPHRAALGRHVNRSGAPLPFGRRPGAGDPAARPRVGPRQPRRPGQRRQPPHGPPRRAGPAAGGGAAGGVEGGHAQPSQRASRGGDGRRDRVPPVLEGGAPLQVGRARPRRVGGDYAQLEQRQPRRGGRGWRWRGRGPWSWGAVRERERAGL